MKIEEISNNTNDWNVVSTSVKIEISLQDDCNIQEISETTLKYFSQDLFKTFSVNMYKYEEEQKKIVLFMNKEELLEELKEAQENLKEQWKSIRYHKHYAALYSYLHKKQEFPKREILKQNVGKRRINVRFYQRRVLARQKHIKAIKKKIINTKWKKEKNELQKQLNEAYKNYVSNFNIANGYRKAVNIVENEWLKVKTTKKEDRKMAEILKKYTEYIKEQEKYMQRVQETRNEWQEEIKQKIQKKFDKFLKKIQEIIQLDLSQNN